MDSTVSSLRALHDLIVPRESISYGDHPSQVVELFLPGGEGPHPVAVVFHGGYWQAMWNRWYIRPLCADLARQGWAVVNAEYRRLGRDGEWPAILEDAAAAVDLVAGLDADLDLDRVVIVGHSAGGHLALWTAARTGLPAGAPGGPPSVEVAAVVGLAPVADLERGPGLIAPDGSVTRLYGGTPQEVPDRYRLGNPARRLPLGVPMLLVHGSGDRLLPAKWTREFAAAARAAGDPVELCEIEGISHGAFADPRRAAWPVAKRWLSTLSLEDDRPPGRVSA